MLKRTFQLLLVVSVLTSALLAADNPFVGDWKLNPSKSKLTDEMKVTGLGANKYAFDFGGGTPEPVVVDGTDQLAGFGTTLSVTPAGPNSWKVVRKKDGRMLLTAAWTLSKDGNTLKDDFTGIAPNGSRSTVNYIYKRRAPGSGFAGTWISTSEKVNFSYAIQIRPYGADGLSFISPGNTRNVIFDGKDYPSAGTNAAPGSTASIRRLSDRTLEMADKVNGKATDTQKVELSSDFKSLTMTQQTVGHSEPTILVFERE
jgi:hypothetical protein